MTLVFLTELDGALVRGETRYDPTWVPLPGSDLDRAETDAEYEAAATDRINRARAAKQFRVTAPSQYWRRTTDTRVLLCAPVQGVESIVGVGRCRISRRDGLVGIAELVVSDCMPFARPTSVNQLQAGLPRRLRQHPSEIFAARESRSLPDATAAATFSVLRRLLDDFEELWSGVPRPQLTRRERITELEQPVVDAQQSALRFFTPRWTSLEPVEDSGGPTEAAARYALMVEGTENDYIQNDASVFLDWEAVPGATHGWFEFRSGDRQLLVKNINVSTAETETGADLVYVSRDPDCVVLVQYKLLNEAGTPPVSVFKDKKNRLADQVRRMLSFSNTKSSDSGIASDFRLGNEIGFVKFIEPRELRVGSVQEARPAGRYHPVGLVARMLKTPSRGPRGGAWFEPHGWRSLDGETFARLVRERLVGSRGDITEKLLKILKVRRVHLVLAVEEPRTDERV